MAWDAWGASGRPALDLTLANPTAAGLAYPDHALQAALGAGGGALYQPEPLGLATARTALCQHMASLGVAMDPARTVLCASTSEAYSWLLKVLCNPGDNVLAPVPGYPLVEPLAALEGVSVAHYPLRHDGAWHMDAAGLRAAVSEKTRAVVVVSPNNPTGNTLKAREAAALADLRLPIIRDEVFGFYRLEPPHESEGSLGPDVCSFALGGLSKQCGLPGMKLGFIHVEGPERWVHQAMQRLEWVADTYLSVSSPVQRALPALLKAGDAVRRTIAARLGDNLAWLRAAVNGSPVSVMQVEGGWSACLRLPAVHTCETWALRLVTAHGVRVHPGYFFEFEMPAVLVVSLLCPPQDFHTGVGHLLDEVASAV